MFLFLFRSRSLPLVVRRPFDASLSFLSLHLRSRTPFLSSFLSYSFQSLFALFVRSLLGLPLTPLVLLLNLVFSLSLSTTTQLSTPPFSLLITPPSSLVETLTHYTKGCVVHLFLRKPIKTPPRKPPTPSCFVSFSIRTLHRGSDFLRLAALLPSKDDRRLAFHTPASPEPTPEEKAKSHNPVDFTQDEDVSVGVGCFSCGCSSDCEFLQTVQVPLEASNHSLCIVPFSKRAKTSPRHLERRGRKRTRRSTSHERGIQRACRAAESPGQLRSILCVYSDFTKIPARDRSCITAPLKANGKDGNRDVLALPTNVHRPSQLPIQQLHVIQPSSFIPIMDVLRKQNKLPLVVEPLRMSSNLVELKLVQPFPQGSMSQST